MVSPAGVWICNLLQMLRRWVVTVWIERHSLSAISLLLIPQATAATISHSRWLNDFSVSSCSTIPVSADCVARNSVSLSNRSTAGTNKKSST